MDNQLFTRRKQSVVVLANNQSLLMEYLLMSFDWSAYRRLDDPTRYFCAGWPGNNVSGPATTVATVQDQLLLLPIITPVRSSLAELGLGVVTNQPSTPFRLGLYNSDPTSLEPTSLRWDSGPFNLMNSGGYVRPVNLVMEPKKLYWAGLVKQSPNPYTLRAFSAAALIGVFGINVLGAGSSEPFGTVLLAGVSGSLPETMVGHTLATMNTPRPGIFFRLNSL